MWAVISNQPLYTVDDSNGDVRMSKPTGGSKAFQFVELEFLADIEGDFDEAQRKRLAQIAKRCPVHKTLAHGVAFEDNATFGQYGDS